MIRSGVQALPHHHLNPGINAEQGDIIGPNIAVVLKDKQKLNKSDVKDFAKNKLQIKENNIQKEL